MPVEAAVKAVLKKGLRTVDIMSEGCTQLGCKEMGDAIAAEINFWFTKQRSLCFM